MKCPCCGAKMEGQTPLAALEYMKLGGTEKLIIEAFVHRYPRTVSMKQLIHDVYAHRPDGGPDWPERIIHVVLGRLRKKLVGTGWRIPSALNGPGVSEYRLERDA